MRLAICLVGLFLCSVTVSHADVKNLHVIYNLKLRSELNHFKEDCRLARNIIDVGSQVGEDGSARAGMIVQRALVKLADFLDFDKLDIDVVFKSFLGSQGRRTLIIAGQKVYWVRKDNFRIKEYLVEAVKTMRKKLFIHADGSHSGRYNKMFKELDVLQRLTESIMANYDVKRNRKGEELERRPRPDKAQQQSDS